MKGAQEGISSWVSVVAEGVGVSAGRLSTWAPTVGQGGMERKGSSWKNPKCTVGPRVGGHVGRDLGGIRPERVVCG